VDLRGNNGSNFGPIVATLTPFLDGTLGYIVPSTAVPQAFFLSDGIAYQGPTVVARNTSPYILESPNPRVAVLTDGLVATGGERLAIAFKGRAATRSFGTPTCGYTLGVVGFGIGGFYTLGLATTRYADRNLNVYSGVIPVDETVALADSAVARAIAWLRSGAP
jgi:carboxyl-terminal processing protease